MSNRNIEGTFYGADTPENVLAKYLESHNNLYDQSRYRVTADFICQRMPLEKMHVLEIGCGGGIWSSFFVGKVAQLTSVDIRPHVIEAANLYVSMNNPILMKDNIRWFAGDIKDYPHNGKFDLVFLKDVIEHIQEDEEFIRGIAQRVNEKGFIYIATQNASSLNYLVEGLLYQKLIYGNKDWCGWDPTHVRFYDPKRLRTLARKTGFNIVAWHGMYHLPYRFLSRRIFKRVIEHKVFHWIEMHMGDRWPFSQTGWAIGVLLQRGD